MAGKRFKNTNKYYRRQKIQARKGILREEKEYPRDFYIPRVSFLKGGIHGIL